MKKSISLVLALFLLFSAVPCAVAQASMICAGCGRVQTGNSVYCKHCGWKFEDRFVACSSCGKQVYFRNGIRYCTTCGGALVLPFGYQAGQKHRKDGAPASPIFYYCSPETRFYYQSMSKREKELFSQVYDFIADFRTGPVPVKNNYTYDEAYRVHVALMGDCPELFHSLGMLRVTQSSGKGYTIAVTGYHMDEWEYMSYWQQIMAWTEGLRSAVSAQTDEFRKEEVILQALFDRTQIFTGPRGVHSALVEGGTLCTGYADALQFTLRHWGIPCFSVGGWAHAWNYVKVNGSWYMIDSMWDDELGGHYYTNLPSCLMLQDHAVENNPFTLPQCTSWQDNYAARNGVYVPAGVQKAEEYVRNGIAPLAASGRQTIYVQVQEEAAYQQLARMRLKDYTTTRVDNVRTIRFEKVR